MGRSQPTWTPLPLGLPLRVSIRISPGAQNSCSTVPAAVRDRPEVLSCHRVTGADCYLLDVAVADTAALEDFLDTLAEVGTPVTALILSSPVPRRTLRRPLPAP